MKKIFGVIAIAMLLAGCGGSKSDPSALIAEAQKACDNQQWARAIELCDSVHRAFPSSPMRREAMHINAVATVGLTEQEIVSNDSLLLALQAQADEIGAKLKMIESPVENYYVHNTVTQTRPEGTTGLQARVLPNGDFTLISSTTGNPRHTAVSVSSGAERSTTSAIPVDGERNDRSSGTEIIYFIGHDADTIGSFVASHLGQPMTLTFEGGNIMSINLDPAMAQAVGETYTAADIFRQMRLALLRQDKLQQQLNVARNQVARTDKVE